jgi:cyanophycin synthetase
MQLLQASALHGANICAPRSSVRLILDLSSVADVADGAVGAGFVDALLERLPRLANDEPRVVALREAGAGPTSAAVALAVAAAIAGLHQEVFIEYEFAEVRPYPAERGASGPNQFEILYSFEYPQFAIRCGELAVPMVRMLLPAAASAKMQGRNVDLPRQLDGLRQFAQQQLGDRARRKVATLARRRGIPVHRYGIRPDVFVFGQGRWQKRTNLTITDTTSALCPRITANKPIATRLLRQMGMPVPRQATVQTPEAAVKAAKAIGFPCVVKPQSGNRARGVTANLRSPSEVRRAFKKAVAVHKQVLVEEHLPGEDYRFVVMHGKVVSVIKRVTPTIVGDGRRTVSDLVQEMNENRIRPDGLARNMRVINFDEEVVRVLTKQGLRPDSVPTDGQNVRLLSHGQGGTTRDVSHDIHPDNAAAAVRAVEIMRIDVGGVDFLLPDPGKSYKETGGGMCEVNYMPDIMMHMVAEHGDRSDMINDYITSLFPDGPSARVRTVVALGYDRAEVLAHVDAELRATGTHTAVGSPEGIISDGFQMTDQPPENWIDTTFRVLHDPMADTALLGPAARDLHDRGLGNETCTVLALGPELELDDADKRATQAVIDIAETVVMECDPDIEQAFEVETERLVLAGPATDPRIEAHLAAGGRAVIPDGDAYAWCVGDERTPLSPADLDGKPSSDRVLPLAVAEALRRSPTVKHWAPYARV